MKFPVFAVSLLILFSCNQKSAHVARSVDNSIYYWKSVFKLTDFEKQRLAELKVNTIYLKLFDVDWNAQTRAPMPVAQVRIEDHLFLQQKNVIPAVFITNECIAKLDSSQTSMLSEKILGLFDKIVTGNDILNVHELQIDCDWTSTTKAVYFSLLDKIRRGAPALTISATIRFHQVKYLDKTGVPPIEKGMLMCYNMGNLKNISTGNSIIETEELKKYIGKLDEYPLPLDVAFPIFEWSVLIRKNAYAGLMENLPDNFFDTKIFSQQGNRYELKTDTVWNGYSFKKGDVLRNEKSDIDVVEKCAKLVAEKLPTRSLHVSLYHLDSLTLSKYSSNELENIYGSMR
jgi:hypothetical protein